MFNFKMYLKQAWHVLNILFSSQWKPAEGKTGRVDKGRSRCTEDNHSLCTLCSSSPDDRFHNIFRLMISLNIMWVKIHDIFDGDEQNLFRILKDFLNSTK